LARTTILVVEDDAAIRRGLCDALASAGYEVGQCARGDEAVDRALASPCDLLLLDVLLPGKDGFEVLREVRASHPQLPVILLTARGAEEDRVRGLKLGADDYVVKPFSASELLARVEAVLRRSAERPRRPRDLRTLRLSDRAVDLELGEILLVGGEKRRLSELEASILRYLVAHRGRPIDRRELLQRVWGGNAREMETRTIDMHVRRLREKLERDPARPRYLVTLRSRGYMLADGDAEERPS
jgi:DNA-binding response OmpR family regulator